MKISSVRLTNFQAFSDSGVLQCEAITLLVGRNNSGKSSILNAIRVIQDGFDLPMGELVRVGAQEALVELRLESIPPTYAQGQTAGLLEVRIARGAASPAAQFHPISVKTSDSLAVKTFPAELAGAALFPILADRNLRDFDERITEQSAKSIQASISNLPGLMSNMMGRNNDRSRRFAQTCVDLLGFELGLVPTQNGQHPGLSIDDETAIRLALMGAGVMRLLRLLVYLLRSENKILLIEEPENDLHPDALRYVLDLVREAAATSQIIVTTHSHIVVNALGGTDRSAVYGIEATLDETGVPLSRATVCATPAERLRIMRSLGHQLSDFGLCDAYLILEESSAETVIKLLMSWFTPKLSGRVRTVACYGADDAVPRFSDLHRLFVFAHLEKVYGGRAWVVLDGDAKGKEVVDKLRKENQTWPENHFRTFDQPNFERYYPDAFKDKVEKALNEPNKDRRTQMKHELLAEVLLWTNQDEDRARQAFEASAANVIAILKEIETATMEAPVVADAAIALSTPPSVAWEQDFTQDDQAGPPIDFATNQAMTYRVKPGDGCNMWRFGLKFSTNEEFGEPRYSDRHPLWHLTKDHGQDSLYVTYYDENRQSTGNALAQGTYHGDEATVRTDVIGNDLRIRVDGTPGYERRFPLPSHRHALPSAWADGSPLVLHVVAK